MQRRDKPMYKRQGTVKQCAEHFGNGNVSRMECGNVMTENNVFYSYAEPIIRFAESEAKRAQRKASAFLSNTPAEPDCIFISSEDWSHTTKCHATEASYKTYAANRVYVPVVETEYCKMNDAYVRTNYIEALDKFLSIKKVPNIRIFKRLRELSYRANQYATYLYYAQGTPLTAINPVHDWDQLFEGNTKLMAYIAVSMPDKSEALTESLSALNSMLSDLKQILTHA